MSNDTSMHRHTWDQIPWIVNGSVSETERQVVESHLESCADCREELEFQRRLVIAMENHGTPDIDPRQSWEQLRLELRFKPFTAHCLFIHFRWASRSLRSSVNFSAMHSTRCLKRGPVRYL